MDIWEVDKLFLFIAFVIPGFVMLKAYSLIMPYSTRNVANQLLDAIAYSCINYALLGIPIYLLLANQDRISVYANYAFCLFAITIAPIIWVLLIKYVRGLEFLQKHLTHPIDMPWDYVFSQRQSYWIVATLKDGSKIAGRYAEKSFVSNFPSREQIYLEETWVINKDGGFKRPRANSAGTIIVTSEISHLELFEYRTS